MEYAKIYQVQEGSARREGGIEFGIENGESMVVDCDLHPQSKD
jgi:chorismate synthase